MSHNKSSAAKLYKQYQREQAAFIKKLAEQERLSDLQDRTFVLSAEELADESFIVPEFSGNNVALLPGATALFECANIQAVKAVSIALQNNQLLFLSNIFNSADMVEYQQIEDQFVDADIREVDYELLNHGEPVYLARNGCLAQVLAVHEDGDNSKFRVLLRGIKRAVAVNAEIYDDFALAEVRTLSDDFTAGEAEALLQIADLGAELESVGSAALNIATISQIVYLYFIKWQQEFAANELNKRNFIFNDAHEYGVLLDNIGNKLALATAEKLFLLYNTELLIRSLFLISLMKRDIGLQLLRSRIDRQTKDLLRREQKEYMLRNAIKVLNNELSGVEAEAGEAEKFYEALEKKQLSDKVATLIRSNIDRYKALSEQSPEAAPLHAYISTLLALPWGYLQQEHFEIAKAKKQLDADHYGLTRVKERILEYLAVLELQRKLAPKEKSVEILCLIGPPGVGKTSIASSIAKALERPFQRISVGGINDEAEIRGHRRTYIGAMPGRIIKAIKEAGCDNPVILLDEIDKLTSSIKGDPAAALLEVLDPAQNSKFYDNYLDIPYDLSKVLFITTANTPEMIPEALYDRMDVIYLSAYTANEKIAIAKNYLWPRLLKTIGLNTSHIGLNKNVLQRIISDYTREAGVRQLERCLTTICRKMALKFLEHGFALVNEAEHESADDTNKVSRSAAGAIVVEKKHKAELPNKGSDDASSDKQVKLTLNKQEIRIKDLKELLGTAPYLNDEVHKQDMVGVVTGLAWTAVGGVTLEVEAQVTLGNGKVSLTGNLGEVMKESAEVAWTYIRSQAEKLQVDIKAFNELDVHIHFPEGATPKDGPSAGVTLATALCSLVLQKKVRHKIAMTGEVTLTGRVFPVGGIKEKLMAAYRAKVDEVIIPQANLKDLAEVDDLVKKSMKITPVTSIEEVWSRAIADFPAKR